MTAPLGHMLPSRPRIISLSGESFATPVLLVDDDYSDMSRPLPRHAQTQSHSFEHAVSYNIMRPPPPHHQQQQHLVQPCQTPAPMSASNQELEESLQDQLHLYEEQQTLQAQMMVAEDVPRRADFERLDRSAERIGSCHNTSEEDSDKDPALDQYNSSLSDSAQDTTEGSCDALIVSCVSEICEVEVEAVGKAGDVSPQRSWKKVRHRTRRQRSLEKKDSPAGATATTSEGSIGSGSSSGSGKVRKQFPHNLEVVSQIHALQITQQKQQQRQDVEGKKVAPSSIASWFKTEMVSLYRG